MSVATMAATKMEDEAIVQIGTEAAKKSFAVKGLAQQMSQQQKVFMRDAQGRLTSDINATMVMPLAKTFGHKIPSLHQIAVYVTAVDAYLMHQVSGLAKGSNDTQHKDWLDTQAREGKRLLIHARKAAKARGGPVPSAQTPQGRPGMASRVAAPGGRPAKAHKVKFGVRTKLRFGKAAKAKPVVLKDDRETPVPAGTPPATVGDVVDDDVDRTT